MKRENCGIDIESMFERYKRGLPTLSPFIEKPLPFLDFVSSKEHMNFPPLSPSQLEPAYALLGDHQEENIFDSIYEVAVLLWGKGSGKDTISAILLSYICYWLLCLKDPHSFLGIPHIETLDCLNVARSAGQARNVFFTKAKALIKQWGWLRKHYQIIESGKSISELEKELKGQEVSQVIITQDGILFPKRIRFFSGHSQGETQEGMNLIIFILDESSAFMAAAGGPADVDKLYNILISSARSRFPGKFKGFILSYPRHAKDFTMKMFDLAGMTPGMFRSKKATWEVNPLRKEEDFKRDFDRTPEEAERMYKCNPPEQEDAYYKFPKRIDMVVNKGRLPLAEYDITTIVAPNGQSFVGKKLVKYNIPKQSASVVYKAWVDLGKDACKCCLNIGRVEGVNIIQELVLEWVPDIENKIPVLFRNVQDVILDLRTNLINLCFVGFDQWNSAFQVEDFNLKGIESEVISLHLPDHNSLREKIYGGEVSLLNYPNQVTELKRLKLRDGKTLESDIMKDSADSLCGLAKILMPSQKATDPRRKKHREGPENEYEPANEREDGSAPPGTGFSFHLH